MSPSLRPEKLHVTFKAGCHPEGPELPRCYTLTHSDRTGDLFLTISPEIDREQVRGWYTRLMRDEVVACWQVDDGEPSLQVELHVSGGLVLGSAAWRNSIFQHHLRQVLEAFRHGDRQFFSAFPELDTAPIQVHFNSSRTTFNRVETWGCPNDYQLAGS